MMRFVAGVLSALLLVAAGFFVWTGMARDGGVALPPPPAAAGEAGSAEAPPQATEATKEARRFGRYDRDRDGAVGRDEYLLSRRKAFARLDGDGDGTVSFEEYAAKSIAKFTVVDADKSGGLGPEEFATTRVVRKASLRCPPATAQADDG